MRSEGKTVTLSQIAKWFGIPRRTLYYRPRKRIRRVSAELESHVKMMMEKFPTYGYRRIAVLIKANRKSVQRILQIRNWQVRRRPKGSRPRAQAMPSVAPVPNMRWATDLTSIWCGKDQWCNLALVIDCGSRELIGWRLSKRGNATTAEAALEEAIIQRYGVLGCVQAPLILRSDNGLVFTSRQYMATVKAYGLTQEFITPYTPEQNGVIERFNRSLKEECVWQHRFESIGHANNVIARWIAFYNHERPHQSLGYLTPAESAKLAA